MTIRKPLIVGAMIAALLTGSAGLANAAGSAPAGHEWIGSVPDGHHENSAPDGHHENNVPAGHHDGG